MDYHLENKIILSEESEYQSLYTWSLQEFDKNGKKIGRDQIPWKWNLYFIASELRHSYSIEIKNSEPTKESEVITAILHPGICRDGKSLKDDVSYSMFGTNQRINTIELYIRKTEEGSESKNKCHIWGSPSYTTEMDFRNVTIDDMVIISLDLSPVQFTNLVELMKVGRIDMLEIRLRSASGFYSEWSPSIKTNSIKILTDSKEQKIITQDGCKIEPPRLGEVYEFNITGIQRHKLNPKQDLRRIDIDQLFEEPEDKEHLDEPNEENPRDKNSLILSQLVRNEVAFNKLSTPIWLILIVLCGWLIHLMI